MKIKAGQILKVDDCRKGRFKARAMHDFDTEADEWYPIQTLEYVCGVSTEWFPNDSIPCRRSLAKVEVIEDEI